MVFLTILLLKLFTQHKNESLFMLPIGKKQFLLRCERHVSCKGHSSTSIPFRPFLVCHVLRVSTLIAIKFDKYDYDLSVLLRTY